MQSHFWRRRLPRLWSGIALVAALALPARDASPAAEDLPAVPGPLSTAPGSDADPPSSLRQTISPELQKALSAVRLLPGASARSQNAVRRMLLEVGFPDARSTESAFTLDVPAGTIVEGLRSLEADRDGVPPSPTSVAIRRRDADEHPPTAQRCPASADPVARMVLVLPEKAEIELSTSGPVIGLGLTAAQTVDPVDAPCVVRLSEFAPSPSSSPRSSTR